VKITQASINDLRRAAEITLRAKGWPEAMREAPALERRAQVACAVVDLLTDIALDLWPDGDPEAEHNADTLESIARRLDFMRPTGGEG
jgi:hypothetical protein